MMRCLTVFCVSALLSTTVWAAKSAKTKIRHSLSPGQHVMTVTNHSEGTTTIGGTPMRVLENAVQVWRMDVAAPNQKDEKKVTVRLNKITEDGEENGQAYRFDSEGQGEQKGERDFVYKPLLASDLTVTLDADDSVVEATGLTSLWTSLAEKASTEAQKALVAELKISMSDKFIEGNFRRLESMMPKNAVAVGDSWKSGLRIDFPVAGEIKVRYDCKLVALEKDNGRDVAVIEATANYALSSPRTTQAEGATINLNKIDMEEKATLKVDLLQNLVIQDENVRKVLMEGKASQGGEEKTIVSRVTNRTKTVIAPGGKDPAKVSTPREAATPDKTPATPAASCEKTGKEAKGKDETKPKAKSAIPGADE